MEKLAAYMLKRVYAAPVEVCRRVYTNRYDREAPVVQSPMLRVRIKVNYYASVALVQELITSKFSMDFKVVNRHKKPDVIQQSRVELISLVSFSFFLLWECTIHNLLCISDCCPWIAILNAFPCC